MTFPAKTTFTDGSVLSASEMNALGGNINDLAYLAINAQTGTTYTLVLTDEAKTVTLTNASSITLTVPPNSSVAFPIGTQIVLYQGNAGQVRIAPGSGVTLNSNGSKLKLTGQYAVASLIKIASDTWVVGGNLSA